MSADDCAASFSTRASTSFEEEGLAALSMREVARRAGVSHQAPYHHFRRSRRNSRGHRDGRIHQAAHGHDESRGNHSPTRSTRLNAVGGAYLTFAVRNQAHFKIMFRSELVAIDKHEELKARADAAFDFVTSIVAEVAQRRGAKDTLPLVVAAWSLAHGAATLLLEGKLDHRYGTTDKKRMAGAMAAIEAFGNLMARD